MKIIDCEQGSDAWIEARLGIPTASCFDQIITPKKGEYSASAPKYAYKLIAEKLLRRQTDSLENLEWVEHGKMTESDAVNRYEFDYGVVAKKVGFITNNEGTIGASPDRILPNNIGMEVKCPAPWTHIAYMLGDLGDKYKTQVQGQNYVGEFDSSVFWSYNAEFQPYRLETPRDEPFIKLLAGCLDRFNNEMADMIERIRVGGFFVERERIAKSIDMEYEEQLRKEA